MLMVFDHACISDAVQHTRICNDLFQLWCFHGGYAARYASKPMSWGHWMVVEFSVEEELRIESQSRTVLHCEDPKEVARLCSSLVKQNAYLSQLVKQATGHIAELEMIAAIQEMNQDDPRSAEVVKLLCESGNWDLVHPGGTQDRNLFARLLGTILAPVFWLLGAFVGLLVIGKQTMSRGFRG